MIGTCLKIQTKDKETRSTKLKKTDYNLKKKEDNDME